MEPPLDVCNTPARTACSLQLSSAGLQCRSDAICPWALGTRPQVVFAVVYLLWTFILFRVSLSEMTMHIASRSGDPQRPEKVCPYCQ